MRNHNSLTTRVKPIFGALYNNDHTGERWLKTLLEMAHRGGESIMPETPCLLIEKPFYEFPVNPPREFLRWLIDNYKYLASPPPSRWARWHETVRECRKKLLHGDRHTIDEAVNDLNPGKREKLPYRAWWRLEGMTRIDCALLTSTAVIFIEGKRTENSKSRKITWYKGRNELLRNLDCAAEYARNNGKKEYYVLLIVENEAQEQENTKILNPAIIERSLPHLDDNHRAEKVMHYLGAIRWEAISEKFGIPLVCDLRDNGSLDEDLRIAEDHHQ